MIYIDEDGMIDAERIAIKRFTGLERGAMLVVNGIVVHQTNGPTADSTFGSYSKKLLRTT